jgi:hypothetical protein
MPKAIENDITAYSHTQTQRPAAWLSSRDFPLSFQENDVSAPRNYAITASIHILSNSLLTNLYYFEAIHSELQIVINKQYIK